METQTYINIGLILALISSFVYTGVQGEEPTHYCESRELIAHCFTLSTTLKTCYTLPARTGGKRCTEGWKEIPKHITSSYSSKEYKCPKRPNPCEEIN